MGAILPQPQDAVAFLQRFHPDRPWCFTSVRTDRKATDTATFLPAQAAEVAQWLDEHVADNIYFSVGEPMGMLTKKAELTDIKTVHWFHVDLDPRPGETDLAAERERALKLLREGYGGIPPATCIVNSGGGVQGFWQLSAPIPIEGDAALADEVGRYNQQIEVTLGGDHCHNIDRIMRLPGTINRPNEKKRKKGQVEAVAHVVEWHDFIYTREQFKLAPKVQGGDSGFGAGTVQVSKNVRRLANIDELGDKVSGKCKMIIVQGFDPDEPNKHGGSRSEWLFWVCCELVRAGVDNDTIFSVITDPDLLISASVLDKGSRSDKYAIRQIERAQEEAIDPWLRKLNEEYAVVGNVGGKCRIVTEITEQVGKVLRSRITYQSFDDFKNYYLNKFTTYVNGTGETVRMPVGQWWLTHAQRREYKGIVFAPNQDIPGYYNLWKGFAFDAKPGDCDLFLEHVLTNVCNGDEDIFRYVVGWMAQAVQLPDRPGNTAIVMRGRQGTGKGVFAKTIGTLFGRHFVHVGDHKHLVGNFNAHLRDCIVLFADEALYAGDKRHESILKMLVTEETLTIEKKGVDAEASSNFIHLILASNNQWVVPAGVDERRFLVLDVSEAQMQNAAYFAAIDKQLRNGGYAALLHFLMTYDLTAYDSRALPKTAALQEQKLYSLSAEEEWWYGKLQEGRLDARDWPDVAFSSALTWDFTSYAKQWSSAQRGNGTKLGRFLAQALPNHGGRAQLWGKHLVRMENGEVAEVERPWIYKMPTLAECRAHWDSHFGGPYPWKDPEVVKPTARSTEPSADVPF